MPMGLLDPTGRSPGGGYTRRGEPGKLVWWNSETLTSNYTITNKASDIDKSIEGMDYNSQIASWDYISYAPNIIIESIDYNETKIWSRELDSSTGQMIYTTMGERSFEEYIDSLP